MQLPDKLMKMIKLGNDDAGGEGMKMVDGRSTSSVAGGDKDKMNVTVDTDGGGTVQSNRSSSRRMTEQFRNSPVQKPTRWIAEHPSGRKAKRR